MTDVATAPDTAQRTVDDWLAAFNAALEAQDAAAAAELFATDGFLRDLVALTWNITTAEGRDEIETMLTHTLGQTRPRGFVTLGAGRRGRWDRRRAGWSSRPRSVAVAGICVCVTGWRGRC